jgi:ABC-type Mn2+/Zn2+ transport system permease subunit
METLVETSSLQQVLEACFWLSLFAAPWGTFLVYRRLSYFGDAVGHSSLLGVAVAFLAFGLSPIALAIGALASVMLTSFLLQILEKKGRIPADVALTVTYSGLFSLGLLVLDHSKQHIEHFLFGDIWSLDTRMLWFLRLWAVLVLVYSIVWWKPLWATVQDQRFAKLLGFSTRSVQVMFLVITSVSVVGVMQTVGIVLVTAFFVLPAVITMPWARSLQSLVWGAMLAALTFSFCGVLLSLHFHLSAGPCIAFSGFLLALVSNAIAAIRKF